MELSDRDIDRIRHQLDDVKCLQCGNGDFVVPDCIFTISAAENLFKQKKNVQINGFVRLICKDCGFLMDWDARTFDLESWDKFMNLNEYNETNG